MRNTHQLVLPILLILFFAPTPAHANVGLPVIIPLGRTLLIALAPIIAVEACVISIKLSRDFGPILWVSAHANIISTIIGLPIAWILGPLIGNIAVAILPKSNAVWKDILRVVARNLFWIRPGYFNEENINWILPSIKLFLLVPCFFLSWKIELNVVSSYDLGDVSGALFTANLVSYALLVVWETISLINSRRRLIDCIADLKKSELGQKSQLIHRGRASDGSIITAYKDGTIRFLDANTWELMKEIAPPVVEVKCQAVSRDGRLSLMEDDHYRHTIWNNISKRKVCSLEDDDPFNAAAFSPDSRYVAAVADYHPDARLWDAQTGRLIVSACVEADDYSIEFTEDGRIVQSGDKDIFLLSGDKWEINPEAEIDPDYG